MYYVARIVRPEHAVGRPENESPLCGILGLPSASGHQPYIGNRFCMPVVGGGKQFCEPYEYDTFSQAMDDIEHPDNHRLGLAFDHPVPVTSVLWSLRIVHSYDGSSALVAHDSRWPDLRSAWLKSLGAAVAFGCYLSCYVSQRIVEADGLTVPVPYSVAQLATYRDICTDKPGAVDAIARAINY